MRSEAAFVSRLAGVALVLLLRSGVLFAEGAPPSRPGFFPKPDEVFSRAPADPRELQLALRLAFPVSNRVLGEASVGTYWGLYRWAWPDKDASLQVSLGGGVFALFDMVRETRDLQVADYYANVPIDFRTGRWSSRLLLYHVSSHLGDDYVDRTRGAVRKYATETLKWLAACEQGDHFRFYGGPLYIVHTLQAEPGLWALQGGVEAFTSWRARGHLQAYWANDWQSWQRARWNPQWNSQLGLRIRNGLGESQGLAVFAEYSAGRMPYGQFFLREESRWTIGGRFYLP